MENRNEILEIVMDVLKFVLAAACGVCAFFSLAEERAGSLRRGLVWLAAGGLWLANGILSVRSGRESWDEALTEEDVDDFA